MEKEKASTDEEELMGQGNSFEKEEKTRAYGKVYSSEDVFSGTIIPSKLYSPTRTINYSTGSAVTPGYPSTVYENISAYRQFIPDKKEEIEEYIKMIRKIYIDELKKSSRTDKEMYEQQKRYGLCIFILSLFMTIAGISFSIIQFLIALRIGDFSTLATELEIQKTGILILRTSAIGAFVLTISLLYFFLFLNFVYKPNTKRKDFFAHIKGASDFN